MVDKSGAKKTGPGKVFDFQLLKKKQILFRLDVFPIFITAPALWFTFGNKIFDREELVPVLSFMLFVTFHSLMFFVNFWNADMSVIIQYTKLDKNEELSNVSHIWVSIHNKK